MPGRPSHATAVAYVALFIALGGTSVAAVTKLKANSVTSSHIKNGAIKHADLAAKSVGSDNVVDGSLLKADFAAGQLPAGEKGATGATGAAGATGSAGANGTNGTNGAKGDKGDDGTNGTDGAALKNQMLCSNCTVTQTGGGTSPITLTNNSFTPAANQANQVYARVTWTPPATSGTCTGPGFGGQVDILLDGVNIGSAQAPNGAATQVTSQQVHVFASATPTAHTVSATVAHNCGAADAASATDARADVVAFVP